MPIMINKLSEKKNRYVFKCYAAYNIIEFNKHLSIQIHTQMRAAWKRYWILSESNQSHSTANEQRRRRRRRNKSITCKHCLFLWVYYNIKQYTHRPSCRNNKTHSIKTIDLISNNIFVRNVFTSIFRFVLFSILFCLNQLWCGYKQ